MDILFQLCLFIVLLFTTPCVGNDMTDSDGKDGGQLLSSTFLLSKLMSVEKQHLDYVNQYLTVQREHLNNLKLLKTAILDESHSDLNYDDVDNPLNAYRIVNRFVGKWKKVYRTVFNITVFKETAEKIKEGLAETNPQNGDFFGAYSSLFRLQNVYSLKPEDIASGRILHRESEPLTQDDCYNMALTFINNYKILDALEWVRLAGEMAENELVKMDIKNDVEDFKSRVRIHGEEEMRDIILDYLMESLEIEVSDDEEEHVDGPTQRLYDEDQSFGAYNNEVDYDDRTYFTLDDTEEDEVGSEDFIPGELYVGQFSDDMQSEQEAIDQSNVMAEKLEFYEDDNQYDNYQQDNAKAESYAHLINPQSPLYSNKYLDDSLFPHRQYNAYDAKGTPNEKMDGEEIAGMVNKELEELDGETDVHNRMGLEGKQDDTKLVSDQLCRGENVPIKSVKALYCKYSARKLPYDIWKEELINRDPYIKITYEAISDTQIVALQDIAASDLKRAMAGAEYMEARVAAVSWHEDTSNTTLTSLSLKAEAITGIDVRNAGEKWQIGQYGIGGHYAAHYDFMADHYKEQYKDIEYEGKDLGQRIATYMLYLNDVEVGGHTIFPHLGVYVKPVKGAAIFWYNVRRDGTPDARTLHAGCPVLLGHKWIANKWIHGLGQEFHRPCGLSQDASDVF